MTDVYESFLDQPQDHDCWGDEDEAELVCRAVKTITPDVKSFFFEPPAGRRFHFEPGQFITLKLTIDGTPVERCYTVSSPPTRPYLLSITVKRVVGGPVSNWLHDNVTPGFRVTVRPPLGVFTLTAPTAPKYLFLSAGSGITPMMSMTRTATDLCLDTDIMFVHSARTPVDIIFRRELGDLAAVNPGLHVAFVCEGDHEAEVWDGLRGRLSAAALQAYVPDLAEREVYACGPTPYMAAVRHLLEDLGFDMARYHEESFTFETVLGAVRAEAVDEAAAAVADASAPAGGAPRHRIQFAKLGTEFECGADEFILDAAFAAGLRLPSSCTQGMCGTCKVPMSDGDVDMQHQGGIRPKEIAAGKILPCCSKPLSDIVIDA